MTRRSDLDYRKAMRKRAKAEETSVSGTGKSIIEKLRDELDRATKNYLTTKQELEDDEFPDRDLEMLQWEKKLRRGIVRGLAMALGMYESPYYPKRGAKNAERESMRRIRSG